MLLRMLTATGGPDGIACFVGDVHEIPDVMAHAWIAQGRAVAADGVVVPDTGMVTVNGDPVVATRPSPRLSRR